jgi:hypothetical protein
MANKRKVRARRAVDIREMMEQRIYRLERRLTAAKQKRKVKVLIHAPGRAQSLQTPMQAALARVGNWYDEMVEPTKAGA